PPARGPLLEKLRISGVFCNSRGPSADGPLGTWASSLPTAAINFVNNLTSSPAQPGIIPQAGSRPGPRLFLISTRWPRETPQQSFEGFLMSSSFERGSPQQSVWPAEAQQLLRWVSANNPFYVISAGLFLVRIWLSFGTRA